MNDQHQGEGMEEFDGVNKDFQQYIPAVSNSEDDQATTVNSLYNSMQERKARLEEAQIVLDVMKERDTRKNIRGYRDEYREILKEKGIFKNTSSLTNINLECGQLDQKLKQDAFKLDPTSIKEDQDVIRQHRILNSYVQGFQNMLCLNQKKKDGNAE